QHEPDFDSALDDDFGDDLLRLIFTTCHPVLSTEARVALTLRLLGGLTTEEIARAYLIPETTGFGPCFVKKPCGSAGFWRKSLRTNRRSMGLSRLWKFNRRGLRRGST